MRATTQHETHARQMNCSHHPLTIQREDGWDVFYCSDCGLEDRVRREPAPKAKVWTRKDFHNAEKEYPYCRVCGVQHADKVRRSKDGLEHLSWPPYPVCSDECAAKYAKRLYGKPRKRRASKRTDDVQLAPCALCRKEVETTAMLPVNIKQGRKFVQHDACDLCAGVVNDSARGANLKIGSVIGLGYLTRGHIEESDVWYCVVIAASADGKTFDLAMTQTTGEPRKLDYDTITRDSVNSAWWAFCGDEPCMVGIKRLDDKPMGLRIVSAYRQFKDPVVLRSRM